NSSWLSAFSTVARSSLLRFCGCLRGTVESMPGWRGLNPFLVLVVRRSTMELVAYESRSSVNDIQLITRVVAGDAADERELADKYRPVFVMHDVEGYTPEEISGALNMPIGTSKSPLFQARSALRVALADFAPEWAS